MTEEAIQMKAESFEHGFELMLATVTDMELPDDYPIQISAGFVRGLALELKGREGINGAALIAKLREACRELYAAAEALSEPGVGDGTPEEHARALRMTKAVDRCRELAGSAGRLRPSTGQPGAGSS